MENTGILTAAGLIAGEGLMGLTIAGFVFARGQFWKVMAQPYGVAAIVFMLLLVGYLVFSPLRTAGSPDEPAPPPITM